MGFFDSVANKSVPEGSGLAKPLMLAFIALLASGALTRKQAQPQRRARVQRPAQRLADCWED
jgi:hypothetical protein